MFLAFRALYSILGLSLYSLGMVPLSEDSITRPYFGITPAFEGIEGSVLGVWQRFDSIHFQRIAEFGYSTDDLTAFLPLYPLAVRAFGYLLGQNMLLSGFLIANLACAVLLITLYQWLKEEGYGEQVTRRSLLYLLVFPTAFFLFVPYSESLFLFLAVVSMREARRNNWGRSSLAAFGASLTRLAGVSLGFVLAIELLRRNDWNLAKAGKSILYAFSPLLAIGAHQAWLKMNEFPTMIELQASFWNRAPAPPWQGIIMTIKGMLAGRVLPIEYVDFGAVLIMLVLGLILIKRMPMIWSVYFWSLILINLSQIRYGQPLSGQARFSLTLFPAFVLIALLTQRNWQNRIIVYPSLALLILLAGQYAMWGWVG